MFYRELELRRPMMSVMMKTAIAIKNNTFAKYAAPAAMPPKPKIAAITAIIRNVIDQRSIVSDIVR